MANKLTKKKWGYQLQDENGKTLMNLRGYYHVITFSNTHLVILIDKKKRSLLNTDTAFILAEEPISNDGFGMVCQQLYEFNHDIYFSNGKLLLKNEVIEHQIGDKGFLITKNLITNQYTLLDKKGVTILAGCKGIYKLNYPYLSIIPYLLIIKEGKASIVEAITNNNDEVNLEFLVKDVPITEAEVYRIYTRDDSMVIKYSNQDTLFKMEGRDIETFDLLYESDNEDNFWKNYTFAKKMKRILGALCNAYVNGIYLYSIPLQKNIANLEECIVTPLSTRFYVLSFENSCQIYDDQKGNIILEGDYTAIKLSIYSNYFILEDGDLKGIADLNGNLLLKPCTSKIHIGKHGFSYIEEKFTEQK